MVENQINTRFSLYIGYFSVSTSNFVEYDPIAAAKGFTELPPEQSKGKYQIDHLQNYFDELSCQEKREKESRQSQKKCRSEKSRE